jgi:hypothetical protein
MAKNGNLIAKLGEKRLWRQIWRFLSSFWRFCQKSALVTMSHLEYAKLDLTVNKPQ